MHRNECSEYNRYGVMKMVQQPISVITVHEEDGSIRPFRFQMKDEEGEQVTIQVKRIVDKKVEKIVGTYYNTFFCLCAVNGMNRTFEIRYRRDMCKWFLMKVI